jgi:hypothetical protein
VYRTFAVCNLFLEYWTTKVEALKMASINQGEEMEGVEMTTKQPLFTEQEQRILDVYDRLEELQLEIALLKARGVLSQGMIH